MIQSTAPTLNLSAKMDGVIILYLGTSDFILS